MYNLSHAKTERTYTFYYVSHFSFFAFICFFKFSFFRTLNTEKTVEKFPIVKMTQSQGFLFSCISFKYVLLLALVSQFNCFLRCRCSMEMWSPDDTERDKYVGPPTWERAWFNSPEWSGGSSPVKTEPHQIGLLLMFLLFLTMVNETQV